MTENLDKYRALHDFVSDPSKAELFGMGGLFGGLKENHAVLKLFATFANELKQKYHHVPNVINSKTFIEYINNEPTLDQGKKEIIVKKIQYIHKKGVIQDEPIARNTLYNFALVLADLNIGEKKELILPQYERALGEALQLSDKTATKPAKSSELTKSERPTGPAESTDATLKNLEGGVRISNFIPGNEAILQSTETGGGYSLAISEEDEEKESLQAKTTNKNDARPSGQPAAVTIPETEQGKKQGPQTKQTLDRPGTGSPIDNGSNKPNLFEEGNDENPQSQKQEQMIVIPITGETIGTEKSETEQLEIPGLKSLPQEEMEKTQRIVPGQGQDQSRRQSQMQVTPQQVTQRRVMPTGKGLRRPMNRPERLSEPSPKEVQSSKEEVQQGQQSADQIPLIPQRNTEEGGSTTRDSGKKSSFGKKLAKLAGAGVGAGVILPLFAGGSTEAADFALHTDFSFIQKIISLLF